MEIKEYEKKYAKEISEIILSNLYTINIKDYNKEMIDSIAQHFTENEIKNNFDKRVKCFVAIENNEVVGTASLDNIKEMYGVNIPDDEDKYIILTVFTKLTNHQQGIGTLLIKAIEKYALSIGAKELIIPASVYGCEFYRNLGYEFYNGKKELNKDGEYILSKRLNKIYDSGKKKI